MKNLTLNHGCPNLINITNVRHLEHLERLEIDCELANSKLKELPKDVFMNNGKLRELVLEDNKIQTIYNDTLKGLVNLEKIYLDRNYITNIPSGKVTMLHKPLLVISILNTYGKILC